MSIGERIKKGRTLRGLSLRELGEKAGISHNQISLLEKGQRNVTGTVLLSLSKALDLPLDYFVKEHTPVVKQVSYRKVKSLATKEDRKIWQMIEQQVENYLELEEIMDINIPFNRRLAEGYSVRTIEDIDTITQLIRKEYKMGEAAISNVASFLEDIGIKVIGIKAKSGFDGVSFFVNDFIPIIAYNTSIQNIERQRMTLLHELGHLLIEPIAESIEDKMLEQLCTVFASHLLLPTNVIKNFFGGRRKNILFSELEELQSIYGISIDAIMYRLKEMLFISEKSLKTYYMKKNSNSELKEKLEKSRYVEPTSNRFLRLINRALDSTLITASKAMVYLKECGINDEDANELIYSKI